MDHTSILESLAKLELDTFNVMNELLTYRIETPFSMLIERARNEHKCRHDYIARRLIKATNTPHMVGATVQSDSITASGDNYSATDERVEPVEVADRAEQRLSKIYKMATALLNVPQLLDLAQEQESLCEEFCEARRIYNMENARLPGLSNSSRLSSKSKLHTNKAVTAFCNDRFVLDFELGSSFALNPMLIEQNQSSVEQQVLRSEQVVLELLVLVLVLVLVEPKPAVEQRLAAARLLALLVVRPEPEPCHALRWCAQSRYSSD